jgi:uncharacterized membrane protein YqjE
VSDQPTSELGRTVQDVTEKAQLLVREEIELAKAEVSEKVNKLVKGAIVGAVAAVFLIGALLFALHAAAWGIWSLVSSDGDGRTIWIGFAILTVVLIVLGAIAAFVALRFVKRGSPPTPQMAIEEAQLIKQTVTSSRPATLAPGATGAVPATEVRS